MTRIRTISEDEAEGRVARSYEAARKRAGRVFNIVRTMSLNPPVLDASMTLYGVVMKGRSPLSRMQRELLATVVSRTNDCYY